jgi:RNA polymerase sigma factor (sigma-70 family)
VATFPLEDGVAESNETGATPRSADSSDPFDDPGLDAGADSELAEFFQKAHDNSSARASADALSALSSQMDAYKLLRPEQAEAKLRAYNDGLTALAELSTARRLGDRKRRQLEDAIRAGEQAQTELVASMFRLVLVIARELASRRYGHQRSLALIPDLVADANVAVVEAVAKFDPKRGPAFHTYTGRVIRERIRASLTKTGLIEVPTSWLRVRSIATTLAPELEEAYGRPATTVELQHALRERSMAWAEEHLSDAHRELPRDQQLVIMQAKLVKQGMMGAIDRYEEVMMSTQQLGNLDAPVGSEGGTRLMDMLADTPSDSQFDEVELGELRQNLLTALADLPQRDRDIILYRFGFADGEVWTYAKIAPLYSISPERVRQIERSALQKLRGPGLETLTGLLDGT